MLLAKDHINFFLLFTFIFLLNCQLQEPTKNHGILFLENRSNQLKVKVNNKNDVLKLIGNPHTKSISNECQVMEIYFHKFEAFGKSINSNQNDSIFENSR